MVRFFITLMISFSVVLGYGQSTANFQDFRFSDLSFSLPHFESEVIVDTCVQVKGQLTTEDDNPMALDYVRIQIIDLDTEEVIRLTTEADGSFEHCLPCKRTFIVLAYPRDYYCEEVRFHTRASDCQPGIRIKVNLPLQSLEIVEDFGEGSNMTSVEEDSISKLRETNKAFLESISIAEEVPVETEEIPTEYVAPPSPRLSVKPIEEKEGESFDPLEVQTEEEEPVEAIISEEVPPTNTENNNTSEVVPPMIVTPIYYPFDSYALDEQEQSTLDEVSRYLLENTNYHLQIAAYTDPRGSKVYNKILAKKRAQQVVEYMLKNGVEATRLIAEAKGEIEDAPDYAVARRTELNIIPETSDLAATDLNLSGTKYVSNIYYDFDDYRLNTESKTDLEKVIDRMLAEPELTVEIRSHTDSRGSSEYNQWLSQKRANEVLRKMVAAGVDSERLKAVGVGEQELVNECADEVSCSREAHAQNRRTEFIFL